MINMYNNNKHAHDKCNPPDKIKMLFECQDT